MREQMRRPVIVPGRLKVRRRRGAQGVRGQVRVVQRAVHHSDPRQQVVDAEGAGKDGPAAAGT